MIEAPPTSTQGGNPIIEAFHPQNLQNIQANEIQAIIMSLQSLIPTEFAPIKQVPLGGQYHQERVTQ